MAIRITTPVNSFVRFSDQHLDDMDWMEKQLPGASLGFALPVCAKDDLAFQFIVVGDTSDEIDTICSVPLSQIGYRLNKNILSTNQTEAQFSNMGAPTFTFTGLEKYRLTSTSVLFYVPSLDQLQPIGNYLAEGQCFQIALRIQVTPPLILPAVTHHAISNVFKYQGTDTDYTTVLQYSSEQDEAGITYCVSPSIKSRVRLPLYLTRPTLPEEESVLRMSSGSTVVTKSSVREVYEVVADQLPKWALLALRAVWLHDDIITDQSAFLPQKLPYQGEIVKEGAYDIEYANYKNYPFGVAKFKVSAVPFLLEKNNCGECIDYSGLLTVTNQALGTLAKNYTYTINLTTLVTASCCGPLTTAIDYYQVSKVLTISITGDTLTIKTRAAWLPFTGAPPLARIKVTCGTIVKYINITAS